MKAVKSPFPGGTMDIGGVALSYRDIGTIAVCLGAVIVLWAFFQFTKIGLALRAAAVEPGRGPPRRRQGDVDARPRLGPRGRARGGRRRAHGAEPRSSTRT